MEWYRTENGKYRIESITAATFHGALSIIRDDFCQDESVSIATEINKNPLAAEELLDLCADAALDGASLVAIENDTGKVVATCFNKIQVARTDSSEKPFFEIFAEEKCKQSSSKALIKFMCDVDERCNLFEKYGVDCSLEIMFLGTLREHRGQQLGANICRISVEIARKLKDGPVSKFTVEDLGPAYSNMVQGKPIKTYPKICQGIWTVPQTQSIGKKLNFTPHLTIPFDEFVYEGKTYAERLGPSYPCCQVAALPLY